MSLKDYADKYALLDYNCAEAILHGANEYYNLGLTDKEMKLVGCFGGGMQVGDLCGGLTGAATVISAKYIENRAHEDRPGLRDKITRLVRAFQKKMGSRLCKDIKPQHFTPELKCRVTIGLACEVLEEVINEIEHEKQTNEA